MSVRGDGRASASTWRERALTLAPLVAVYLFVTWLTEPHFMADTVPYADAVLSGDRVRIWEFGHLLWRPLGAAARATVFEPLLHALAGADTRAGVVLVLVLTSWVAGLVCVLSLAGIVRRVCRREWVVLVACVAFVFAHGFLNFAQAGASYVAGLAFLLLGMYALARGARGGEDAARSASWLTAMLAGASLALAVGMWFLYIWALPAAIVSPLLLFGWTRQRLRLVVQTTLACALFGAVIFGAAMGILSIYTVEGFREWVLRASHGATTSGFARMVFGFARSFINMGNDGMLFKRFMLKDPYNPVSLVEIFRLSLWKLGLFYLFIAAVVVNLARSGMGRRVLALLTLSALPMLGFAVVWQGGDIERYLPLYPFVFLALACALESERGIPWLKGVALLFVVLMGVTSVGVMAKPVLRRQEAAVMSRLEAVRPRLKPESTVVTVHQQDELWKANYSFPFNPFFREHANLVYAAAALGTVHTLRWREDFASHAFKTWRAGGDVWLSKRLYASRPRAEWNWVEGFAPMSWTELHEFFAQMETGEAVGDEDGFVLLLNSERNQQRLRPLAERDETK
jgi:hypothetical protein